jgi:transcriptional regulator with XRE-family HTH domain
VTINEYLDAVKAALGCRTDARLAECLGVVQSRISHYRKGRVLPNIHMARRLASALNIRAATLISDIRKEKARRARRLAKRNYRSPKAGRRT